MPPIDETLAAAALACLAVRSYPKDCPASSSACSHLSRLSFSASVNPLWALLQPSAAPRQFLESRDHA
eukprot:4708636-Pyramimonas_sp.AAC.1